MQKLSKNTDNPAYTPNTIARNVKHLGNGVIEVRRYNDGSLREVFLVLFFVFFFFFIKDIVTKKGLYSEMRWAVNPEISLRSQYKTFEKLIPENLESYEDYKNGMLAMHSGRRVKGWIIISIPFLLLILAGYPKGRPLRIDPKRRLVYFWFGRQFFIAHLPMIEEQFYNGLKYSHTTVAYPDEPIDMLSNYVRKPLLRYKQHSILFIDLPHETDPEKSFGVDLGIFRPACNFQHLALKAFLNDYLSTDNPEEKYANYFKKESIILSDFFNLFFQFSLFPAWGYNEKKTEAKIQTFLAKLAAKRQSEYPEGVTEVLVKKHNQS